MEGRMEWPLNTGQHKVKERVLGKRGRREGESAWEERKDGVTTQHWSTQGKGESNNALLGKKGRVIG